MIFKNLLVFLGGVYVGQEIQDIPRVSLLANKISRDLTKYFSDTTGSVDTPKQPQESKSIESPTDKALSWWIWGGRK